MEPAVSSTEVEMEDVRGYLPQTFNLQAEKKLAWRNEDHGNG